MGRAWILKSLSGAVLGGLLLFGQTSAARAGFVVQVTNDTTGNGFQLTETSPGVFGSPTFTGAGVQSLTVTTLNESQFVGTAVIDNYSLALNTTTNEEAASPTGGQIGTTVNLQALTGATQGTFRIRVSDSDYTTPAQAPAYLSVGLQTGQITDMNSVKTKGVYVFNGVTQTVYLDNGSGGGIEIPYSNFLSNKLLLAGYGTPYSLANVEIDVNCVGQGSINFTGTTYITGVPEPSSLCLVAAALPLALAGLRRWKRGPVVA